MVSTDRFAHFTMTEGTVIVFAVWTIAANVTALTGGSLYRVLVLFILGMLGLGVGFLRRRWFAADDPLPCNSSAERVHRLAVLALVFLAVALSLVAHRPDADDSTYVNFAVAAVDDPSEPILSRDTRHPGPGVPPLQPAYKVHSIEMLAAVISWLTGLSAIAVLHLLLAPAGAALAVMAYRDLFLDLVPKYWAPALIATMLFLIANGDAHASYGNFSFVRLHQGKGALVTVFLPLILVFALRFSRYPSVRSWLLLAGSQVSAVGMSSTALWLAPTTATVALVAGCSFVSIKRTVQQVGAGLTSSIYVVGLGMVILMTEQIPERIFETHASGNELVIGSLQYVFGYTPFAIACALIAASTWALCEQGIARRFGFFFPLVVIVVANPMVASPIAERITGVTTYWRVWWLLPLPALAGLFFAAPFRWCRRPRVASLLFIICLSVLLFALPQHTILSQGNGTRLGRPGLKVPSEYEIGRFITHCFPDRPTVLAPDAVSTWLPTFHHHPYPLLARSHYTRALRDEGHRRLQLKRYVAGIERPAKGSRTLQEGLIRYGIGVVCLTVANPWRAEIEQLLQSTMYPGGRIGDYQLWIRKDFL